MQTLQGKNLSLIKVFSLVTFLPSLMSLEIKLSCYVTYLLIYEPYENETPFNKVKHGYKLNYQTWCQTKWGK